jgi:hypothetical protein
MSRAIFISRSERIMIRTKEKPPREILGGRKEQIVRASAFQRVAALAVLDRGRHLRRIFLPRTPEMKPRTEWACQPVAFMRSAPVAPVGRFSRSRTLAVLPP